MPLEHVALVVNNKPYLIHGPGGSIRQLCEMIIDAGHGPILKDIKIHWCSESSYGHKERLEPLVKEFHEQYGQLKSTSEDRGRTIYGVLFSFCSLLSLEFRAQYGQLQSTAEDCGRTIYGVLFLVKAAICPSNKNALR